tara:strand:- start:144 stop:320 length:177 start_codon:yes stop_codon:yes gene_type:complete
MSPEEHQKWRLKMLNFWRDRLEQRMAGVDAAIATLVKQMERDKKETDSKKVPTDAGTS